MQLIKKHPLAVLATVIVMFLVFFGYRLFGESAKVVDVVLFTVFSAALLILPAMELGDEIMKLLRNMEPKASTASGSVNAIEPYRQRSQREDLEQSLVHALAPGLVSGMTGAEIGKYIRESADAIMGSAQNRFVGQGACYAAKVHGYAAKVGDLSAKTANCTCGPADRCNNCPTPSAQADQRIEAELVAAGLDAPRVTADHIQALMDRVVYHYEQPQGTTSTFAHAFLDGFYLASGYSACVSVANFDAAKGQKYAKEQAEPKARDKLWELEGYVLHRDLARPALD